LARKRGKNRRKGTWYLKRRRGATGGKEGGNWLSEGKKAIRVWEGGADKEKGCETSRLRKKNPAKDCFWFGPNDDRKNSGRGKAGLCGEQRKIGGEVRNDINCVRKVS